MAPPLLKATTSTVNSRVSLISEVKAEPDLPSSSSYTSLRRSTRSTTRTADDETTTSLNLSSYAFAAPPRKRVKLEPKTPSVKAEDDEPLVKLEDTTPILPSSGSATPKKGLPLAKRSKAHPEPAKWREQYALIERMRAGIDAPVDTMYVFLAG
jgi:endonuclease-3